MKKSLIRLILGGSSLALIALVTACNTTPITIIVTPTSAAGGTATLTATGTTVPLTNTATNSAFGPAVNPSTANPSQIVTAASATPSASPTAISGNFGPITSPNATFPTVTPSTPSATVTPLSGNFGPIIGPNYTPPPSSTPPPPGITPSANITLPPIVTPGPSPTPGPILKSALMGIQIHGFLTDSDWDGMLARARALGVAWIKVQIQWKELEPSRDSFNQLYQSMVLHMQKAHLDGFHTLISIAKGPGWSHGGTLDDGPGDDPNDLANFAAHFISDVKPEFLDAVEVWNEPNIAGEWGTRPLDGGDYMKYFRAVYAAIQTVEKGQPAPNHRLVIITAGAAPTATNPGHSLDDRVWLRELYANGLAAIGDDVAVGVHPYGWANPPGATCCTASPGIHGWYEYPSFYFRNTIEDYRAIMVQNNHAAAKLWPTEFGWASWEGFPNSPPSGDEWQSILNQAQQANYELQAFYIAQQPPYYDYLGPMMLWNLNFANIPHMVDDRREEVGFSIIDEAGNPRPAFLTLQNAPKN